MENPRYVIGASNENASGSYNNNGFANRSGYDENDLYEYDPDSSKGISGRVKDFLGSVQLKSDDDSHSTHQYKRDIIDSLCSQINQTLLIPKAFYFFFFAAFGSLFPLMAIYFKQMAMSPSQVGLIFGLRLFVEFLSVPFWANVGEKWKKGKIILLGSLLCWILFTLGIGFIKPPVHSCLMHNETHIFLEKSKSGQISQPAPNKIVSGGYNVINKRSVDYQMDYDNYNKHRSNYNSDIAINSAFNFMLRKKRNDENGEKVYKYINITKIIKIKKTNISTTTFSTTTTSTKPSREKKPKVKTTVKTTQSTDQVEEIEFDAGNLKMTTTEAKSILNNAIDKAENELIEKSQQSGKSNQVKDESKQNIANTAIQEEVINTVKNINKLEKNKTSTKNNDFEEELKTTIRLPSTTPVYKPNLNDEIRKSPEKTHYFDPDPLDSSKNRAKIVYLNDSTLRLVKPSLQTSIVYHKNDVHKVFIVFLIFILAGEFFSAPAITLADTCTLQYLGQSRADLYGRQRMFGSLGWALAMFSVGILLDHSKAFTDHPCGKAGPDERNYSVCFAFFSVLMGCALIIATQFKFNYGDGEQIPLKSMVQSVKSKVNKVRGEKYQQFDRKKFVNESDEEEQERNNKVEEQQAQNNANTTGFNEIGAQNPNTNAIVDNRQKHLRLFEICKTWKLTSFLFVLWFMGIGAGIVFTFLFWHLQDLGGTPALYGIASVINHMSELMAYFFVHQIVRQFGHVKIFYAGLLGNAIRFVYVSVLTEPYWILPFEFIQGITHALVWATATSYFAQSVPDDLRSSAQGYLQGIHFGLGRGCGAVLGGALITSFGTKATFAVYGVLCLLTMIAYFAINQHTLNEIAKQNPAYSQNQFVQEKDPNFDYNNNHGNYGQEANGSNQMPEINNAVNPMMIDTNYYYQPSSSNQNPSDSQLNPTSKSSFPIAPHGVPATNPNWNKSDKSHSKVLNEVNDAIGDEVKSRVRQVTARHKGYEQFSHESDNLFECYQSNDSNTDGGDESNSIGENNFLNDFSHQHDSKTYAKFDLTAKKTKRSFLNVIITRNRANITSSATSPSVNSSLSSSPTIPVSTSISSLPFSVSTIQSSTTIFG